jgi:acetyl esterase/lipase
MKFRGSAKVFITAVCIVLWAGLCQAGLQNDIAYGINNSQETIKLDAYVPDGNGNELFPAVIFVHGGAWCSGDKQEGDRILPELFQNEKIAWFSIEYRLAPQNRWPVCYEDVKLAVKWVKANAAYFKVDTAKIILMGYSAGGHLACLTASQADEQTSVAAVIAFAPPTDLVSLVNIQGAPAEGIFRNLFGAEISGDQMRQTISDVSPNNHLTTAVPPILLVHGTKDQTVPYQQSVDFQAKMRELSVPCELITIENAPHDVRQWQNFDPDFRRKIVSWLKQILKINEK